MATNPIFSPEPIRYRASTGRRSSDALPARLKLAQMHEEILSTTAHILLRDHDCDTLCQSVFEYLRVPMRLDLYLHYLVAADGAHLELASSGGNEIVRSVVGTTIEFGQAVCGTVAQTGKGIYVKGVQHRAEEKTEMIRSFGIRCYACNPLIIDGRLLGTFSFGSSQRDFFTDEELELFRLVVQQVTVATERRLQAERLQAMERLATSGRMTEMLAHEINGPIETMEQLMQLLRDEVLTPHAFELLDIAEDQLQRMSDTTHRAMVAFRGQTEGARKASLSELASRVAEEIRLPHYVHLTTEIEPNLHAHVVPDEVRQVLYNLLLNAAQFSPVAGDIVLQVHGAEDAVEIHIIDQGFGIPQEARMNIFKPFYTTRNDGGSGVGLWVSREMVMRAGGSLTFESKTELRPGTTFTVRLPRVP